MNVASMTEAVDEPGVDALGEGISSLGLSCGHSRRQSRDYLIEAECASCDEGRRQTGMNAGLRIDALLHGAEIGHELPTLSFGQVGPGGHAVTAISLAEEPLEVAICGDGGMRGCEERFLVAVSLGVCHVALLTVLVVDQRAGCYRFGTCWRADSLECDPWGERGPSGKLRRRTEAARLTADVRGEKTREGGAGSSRTSFVLRNQVPIWGVPWPADAVDAIEAGGRQAEAGGEAEAAAGQLPADDGSDVVGGVVQGERPCIAEAAVGFAAGGEFLKAESTGLPLPRVRKGPGGADGIAEFPWLVAEVFLGDEVFGDVPALRLEERISLSSASCSCSWRASALGSARSAWPSWPTTSRRVLSAPVMFSYST